ncbi:hypothetical protein [Paucibacter soli]|uniref:hypothetical protein n=1 Tax=Paucibacter soli TaxID=3133433 RepID=UPI00309BC4E5
MYLVAIAWIYVALMMALAEASSSQGSVLGAIVTFALYGALPVSIVLYLLGTPARRAARRRAEATDQAPKQPSNQADGSGHATAEPLVAEGKEP